MSGYLKIFVIPFRSILFYMHLRFSNYSLHAKIRLCALLHLPISVIPLSVHSSISLSPSVHSFIHPFICLFVRPYFCHLSIPPSVRLSDHRLTHTLSFLPSIYLASHHTSIHLIPPTTPSSHPTLQASIYPCTGILASIHQSTSSYHPSIPSTLSPIHPSM